MKNLCVVLIVIASLSPLAVSAESVRLGAILPLTGDAAALGAACRNGITLALEEGAAGKVVVTFDDDKNSPTQTAAIFQRLAPKSDVLLSWSSATSNAIAPLADRRKIPLIAIATDPKIPLNRSHVVSLWVTPDVEAKLLSAEMEHRGARNMARISTIHDGTLSMRDALDKARGGITFAIDDEVAPSDLDFRSWLLKLKSAQKLDGIVVNLFLGQAGPFAKQARELGIALPFYNIETFEDPAALKSSDGALLGAVFVTGADADGAFLSRYRRRFPGEATMSSSNCYDATNLLIDIPATKINERLHTVRDFQGASGIFSASGDNRFTLPAVIKTVQ